jgi:predicted TIM-barrel fold metal-dependent hydrolase
MLDSLDRLDGRGRGVAVPDDAVDAAGLQALHRRGVRALRINVESAGLRDAGTVRAALGRWAGRVEMLGWHLQLYAALDTIAALAEHLARLPVPVVLDHFAMVPAALAPDHPRAAPLLGLLRSGNAYVKLSAPYRLGAADLAAHTDVAAWAAAFLAAAPDRVLWGSDWPHTDREPGKAAHEVSRYRTLPQDMLERCIATWLPTPQLRQQVLTDNPARLYGF